jgi:AAA+ ATPase superfamily predicted ATPase
MNAEPLSNAVGTEIPVTKERPWPGPVPYTEQSSAFFFGREQEMDELFRLVRASVVSVLYGASGLGKTSLLRAGLFPRRRGEDFLPVYVRLKGETTGDFSRQVLDAVEREAKGQNIACVDWQTVTDGSLWEYLCHVKTEF